MDSVLKELNIGPKESLVVMPLTRVLIEEPIWIGSLIIYPPNTLDIPELFPEPHVGLSNDQQQLNSDHFEGQELRDVQSLITGFDINRLHSSACVCFVAEIDWDVLDDSSHSDDINLLSRLSATAERSFDVLKLHYCRLDLPDTLPGAIGFWEQASPFFGALIYSSANKRNRLIAGAGDSYSAITCGLGLDLSSCFVGDVPLPSEGEVSAIAVHALSLLTDAMQAGNDTIKFVRTMTLLDFLGSPDEYKKWEKIKGDIACHRAKDKGDYLRMSDQLRSFTSMKDNNGKEIGYRTLVVHQGKFLEDILPKKEARRDVFRELQLYCRSVIDSMMEHREMTWDQFVELRREIKQQLGVLSM